MRPFPLIGFIPLCLISCLAAAQPLDEALDYLKKQEYEKARPILEKLSTDGVAEAQVQLGAMYLQGLGMAVDKQKGLALYEAASRQGHAGAQFVFGTELYKGGLIPKDRERAMTLLFASAKQKYAYAQYALCVELSTNDSPYFNAIEAYAWCEASAKKPHRLSNLASQRGIETLGKILINQGPEAVETAKIRATAYQEAY